MKNDRENILINLKNIIQIYSNTISSLQINDLLYKANLILINPQIAEFKDILSLYNQLNTSLAKRSCENDDENLSKMKRIRFESTTCVNEQEQIDDDDEDIIYIQTIQPKSTTTFDGQLEISEKAE
jgi:hypothetical protein